MTSKQIKDEFFDGDVTNDLIENQYLESPQKRNLLSTSQIDTIGTIVKPKRKYKKKKFFDEQNLVATSQINTIVKPKRKYKKKKETLSPFIRLGISCCKDLVNI